MIVILRCPAGGKCGDGSGHLYRLASKSFVANEALERLLTRVALDMANKVLLPAKSRVANVTFSICAWF